MVETVLAYAALFGWSFLAVTVVPIGSEPALFAAIARGHSTAAAVGQPSRAVAEPGRVSSRRARMGRRCPMPSAARPRMAEHGPVQILFIFCR